MKLRQLRTIIFSDVDPATLEDMLNAWFNDRAEEELVGWQVVTRYIDSSAEATVEVVIMYTTS
jgi:hypothetical protein